MDSGGDGVLYGVCQTIYLKKWHKIDLFISIICAFSARLEDGV